MATNAVNGAVMSKSQQENVDKLSLKSEDHRRHTLNRDAMIFGSVSHRDHEVAQKEQMNRSHMSQ